MVKNNTFERYCQCNPVEFPIGNRLGFCFKCKANRPPYTNDQLDEAIARLDATAFASRLSRTPVQKKSVETPKSAQIDLSKSFATRWRAPNKVFKRVAFLSRSTRKGCIAPTSLPDFEFRVASNKLKDVLLGTPVVTDILYLMGNAPKAYADVRSWSQSELPEGWTSGEHFFGDLYAFRFKRPDGRLFEIFPAATWSLEAIAPKEACDALELLNQRVRVRFHGPSIKTTPLNTGRMLFQSTIPYDPERNTSAEYLIASADQQALIQRTAAQGRFEYLGGKNRQLKGLLELDGRLMYAHCARRLFVGPGTYHPRSKQHKATHLDFQRAKGDLSFMPGRYLVEFRVPSDWRHIGLLGAWDEHAGTRSYPAMPGTIGSGWSDGAELLLAAAQGWTFRMLEGITFDRLERGDGPLDAWVNALLKTEADLEGSPIQSAARSMLIKTIGGFSQRVHKVERSLPKDRAAEVPMERAPRLVGDEWRWTEDGHVQTPELSHPEWAAHIWARCRARMATLALEFPREQIIGLSLDALWLDVVDPTGFPTECEVGHLRVKSFTKGPLPRISSLSELTNLRGSDAKA